MNARALFVSLCVSLCALAPATVTSQALTSLQSVRVGYIARRNTVKPQGELKAQIDALDAQIAKETRLCRNGELRRLFAKCLALLNGTPWTETLDYARSPVLRTPRVVVDSSQPYTVQLEQILAPSLALRNTLAAHVTLRKRPAPAPQNQPTQEPPVVKDLGTFDGLARDLRESPFFFDLDLHDVADGPYVLNVEVSNRGEPIGSSWLQVALHKWVDELAARLEADAKRAPESVRAEILFPNKDLAAAENEIIPYRTYVPTTYMGAKAYPLIIALHGLGGTEDAFFENYNKVLPPLAESHGDVVAPNLAAIVRFFDAHKKAAQSPSQP